MKNLIKNLISFHKVFGLTIGNEPKFPDDKTIKLRIDLMKKELKETVKAIKNRDIVETADGLVDLIYVTVGTAVSFGINLEPLWKEIHKEKIGGKNDKQLIAKLLEKQKLHDWFCEKCLIHFVGTQDDNVCPCCKSAIRCP